MEVMEAFGRPAVAACNGVAEGAVEADAVCCPLERASFVGPSPLEGGGGGGAEATAEDMLSIL